MDSVEPAPYFPKETIKYIGQWVAFSKGLKSVAGHGHSLADASDMAEKVGELSPVMMFVSEGWLGPEQGSLSPIVSCFYDIIVRMFFDDPTDAAQTPAFRPE